MNKRAAAQKEETRERRRLLASITRDLVLFAIGVLLIINEAVIRSEPPRESLLVLYGGMVGLPAILRADAIRRNGDK